jgi:hypothetical protein
MLRDDQNARFSVVPDPAAPREDPFLKAVQGAAADDFTVLGEIGRGSDGVIIYLSREVSSGRLVALRLQREGQLAHEFSLELVRHLDNSMPAPESKCFKCGKPIRGWARFCSYCGADLSGAAPATDDTAGQAAMLAALNEAVAADYEVLGEMARSEGGGAVYFARDRATNKIVALRLQREGADGDFSVGLTTALKPLAASLGVKPVATQLLGSLVPPPPPPPAEVAASPSLSTPSAPLSAGAVPPPRPATPPPPPPRRATSRRMQWLLGGAGLILLVFLAVLFLLPDRKAGTTAALPAPAPDTTPAAATATPPPPPPAPAPAAPPTATVLRPPVQSTTGTIKVVHVANNADIEIDGARVAPERATRLNAGAHSVVVNVPGYQPYTDTVHLAAGENHEVSPRLVVAPKVVPRPASAPALAKQQAQDASHQPANANQLCEKYMVAQDWKQAFPQCTTEANAGSAAAKRNIGLMYNHGNGVGRSPTDAVHWYQAAVDGNDQIAMYLLGTYYEHGVGGVKKSSATALELYTRSAQGGYVVAQSLLGEIYEKGHLDQQKDKAKALDWYKKAAAQGDKDASDKVKDLGHN